MNCGYGTVVGMLITIGSGGMRIVTTKVPVTRTRIHKLSYFHPHTTYTSNYPSHEPTGMPTTVNGTEAGSAGVSDPKWTTCWPEALATVSPSSARIMSALFGSSTNVQLPRVPVMLILVLVKSSFAPIVFHIQMGSLMLGWLCTLAAAW